MLFRSPGRLKVILGDALQIAAHELGDAPRRICANLPYNVATPLLFGWLAHAAAFTTMILMFQKEVADRLVASPRDPSYGRLSVATQWRTEARRLFNITARAFTPPPNVDSTVVELIPRSQPLADANATDLERVTAAAFGQRDRKSTRLNSSHTDISRMPSSA